MHPRNVVHKTNDVLSNGFMGTVCIWHSKEDDKDRRILSPITNWFIEEWRRESDEGYCRRWTRNDDPFEQIQSIPHLPHNTSITITTIIIIIVITIIIKKPYIFHYSWTFLKEKWSNLGIWKQSKLISMKSTGWHRKVHDGFVEWWGTGIRTEGWIYIQTYPDVDICGPCKLTVLPRQHWYQVEK